MSYTITPPSGGGTAAGSTGIFVHPDHLLANTGGRTGAAAAAWRVVDIRVEQNVDTGRGRVGTHVFAIRANGREFIIARWIHAVQGQLTAYIDDITRRLQIGRPQVQNTVDNVGTLETREGTFGVTPDLTQPPRPPGLRPPQVVDHGDNLEDPFDAGQGALYAAAGVGFLIVLALVASRR